MTPIKELKDELVAFGERLHFENFERTQLGHLTYDLPIRWLVEDEEPWTTYDFYMRVGLHLGRVTQAIMCCGHFLKMRAESRWPKELYNAMKPLDPLSPDDNLYPCYTAYMGGHPQGHWRPDQGYVANPYGQALQQAQQNLLAPAYYPYTVGGGTSGGLVGGGYGGGISGVGYAPVNYTPNITSVTIPGTLTLGSNIVVAGTKSTP